MKASAYSVIFVSPKRSGGAEQQAVKDGSSQLFTLPFLPGRSLAQAVYLSGVFQPPVLCSGLARCGRCRMLIESGAPPPLPADLAYFSEAEMSEGWRLACRHEAREDMRVLLPEGARRFCDAYGSIVIKRGAGRHANGEAAASESEYLLAVDVGTTTVQWRLLEVHPAIDEGEQTVRPLWEAAAVNPQMGAGSDVISRLAAAMEKGGGERLQSLFLQSLHAIAQRAKEFIPDRQGKGLAAICLAANPAMTGLGLGVDVRGLAHAPYALPLRGGEWVALPDLPPVWLPPVLSPFVGGDISAGYAALALDPDQPPPSYPFLLADLGTNGEFLLALTPEKAWVASVALGPALEGTGLSCGTEARPGAVASFILSAKGLEARPLPGLAKGDGRPASPGITGTGYISLLSILLRAGVLARNGSFRPGGHGPLDRFFKIGPCREGGELSLNLPLGLSLTASDVEELLKVKAAFSLGMRRMLDNAGLRTGQLARIYIAGALGLHVDKGAMEELGFLPQGMASRVEAVGNSSLAGASVLLYYPAVRKAVSEWAGRVESLELAHDKGFLLEYPDQMRFSWV